MHIWILALFQVVFNGAVLNSGGVSAGGFAETQMTTDCATETLADWTAAGYPDIQPLEEAASATQAGDACRAAPSWPAETF